MIYAPAYVTELLKEDSILGTVVGLASPVFTTLKRPELIITPYGSDQRGRDLTSGVAVMDRLLQFKCKHTSTSEADGLLTKIHEHLQKINKSSMRFVAPLGRDRKQFISYVWKSGPMFIERNDHEMDVAVLNAQVLLT